MGSIYHLSEKGGRDVRIYYNNLNQLLRSNQYDVIHSHIYYFSGVTLLIGRISKVLIRFAHSHNIKDVPLIIHAGRFSKQKNHVFLIEVFSEFLKECSNAHLVLVGDGPQKDDIVHLAVEKGIESNIHFLDVRSDIPEILSAGDIFLFPSLYEGIPLVLVEAQAAYLPCLVSEAINKKEVDMGLRLIYSLSLKDDISLWVKQLKLLLLISKTQQR